MVSCTLKAVVVRSCLVIAVLAGAGRADVITWTGGGNDDSWRNADNWDLARIPGPDDDVVIDLPGDYQVVLGGSMTVASLDIAASTAVLNLHGGTQGFDAALTVANDLTNHGKIVLANVDTYYVRNVRLDVASGSLVNHGRIDMTLGSHGGSRLLAAPLDNRGIINIYTAAKIEKSGAASHENSGTINVAGGNLELKLSSDHFNNRGTVTIATGRSLTITDGTWTHDGGSFEGGGALSLKGTDITLATDLTFSSLATVSLQSLTADGTGSLVNDTWMTLTTGTIKVPFTNRGDSKVHGTCTVESDPGGFVNEITGTIRLEGFSQTFDAILNTTNGLINDGTVNMINGDTSVRTVRLNAASGPLVNNRTINVNYGLAGGSRFIDATLDNHGTINIAANATINKTGIATHANTGSINLTGGNLVLNLSQDDFTNTGTITISENRRLEVTDGTWNNNVGSFDGAGALSFKNTDISLDADLELSSLNSASLESVTMHGTGAFRNTTLLTMVNCFVSTAFANDGELTIHGPTNTIESAPGEFINEGGATLRLEGHAAAFDAKLTATNGLLNNGIMVLTNASTAVRSAHLYTSDGALINSGTLYVQHGTGGGGRFLGTEIDNRGIMNITTNATLDKSGTADHVNSGRINVAGPELTVNLADDTFRNAGHVQISASRTLKVNGGTWWHWVGGAVDGAGTWALRNTDLFGFPDSAAAHLYIPETLALSLDHCWYSSRWILENRGTVTMTGSTITGSLDNWGLLIARGTNTITSGDGFCVNLPTGVMRLEAAPGSFNSTLWATDGLENLGSFVMTNTDSSPRTVRLNVLNGAFVNKGTVNTWYASGGGNRVFDAEIDNQGTFNVNSGQATVERNGSADHVNSGTIHAGGNLTFKLAQDTFTNTGTCRVAAGRTLELTEGVFTNFAARTLAGGTYHLLGTFQFDAADVANNAAHLILDGSDAAIVDHLSTDVTNHLSTNTAEGVLHLLNGAWIAVDPNESSDFHNTGQVLLRDTSSMGVAGEYSQTSGITQLAGGTISTGNGLSIAEQGVLGGHGTIFGPVVNAGTISPGPINGHLTIEGVLTLLPASDLVIDIRGPIAGLEYDLIEVHMLDLLDGSATLEGSLHVNLIGGYQPTIGTEFPIVTAEAVLGIFSTTWLPQAFHWDCTDLPYPGFNTVDYRSDAAVLVTFSEESVFDTHPQSQTVCEGFPVTFSATGWGGFRSAYVWRWNGVEIDGAIDEETTETFYTIDSVTLADTGIYDVIYVNTFCGFEISEPATLTVLEPGLGDFDRDCDRDLDDYYFFMHLCQTSPNQQHGTECGVFDFDEDQDVDLRDFGEFQLRFGHP